MHRKHLVFASLRMALALVLIAGFLAVTPVGAVTTIRYVKWNAAGLNNGTSWGNAYKSLQSALASASPGTEIWVAAGTYKPTTGRDRTVSFTLKNHVSIYGGFSGSETSRSQRNPAANVTILSGDLGSAGTISDNSHHVISGGGANRSAVLDGFTVTAGNADDLTTFTSGSGGGMVNDRSSPTVANVIFHGNTAFFNGGGMYNVNTSSPSLTNVTFRANKATGSGGGGISNYFGNPVLRNVVFIDNFAFSSGGGMDDYRSNPILTDVAFINNVSDYHGGGYYSVGEGSPVLTNVTFSGNKSTDAGGGMSASVDTHPTLTNVTFQGNSSFVGGAMYLFFATPTLTNVTISGNTATHVGGVYNEASTLTIRNSILWGNTNDEQIGNRGSNTVTYSIIEGGFPGNGNRDVDPLLGALSNHGGFTHTMALGAGSPAVNMANQADCPPVDQRGVIRPQGESCDIGAYEQEYLSISGNANAAGVTLTYLDGGMRTVTSAVNGNYSLGVPPNWSGTVTPSHPCFAFSPVSRSYSNQSISLTAESYSAAFNPVSGCAHISTLIDWDIQGRFGLLPGASIRASFSGINKGPVQILSHNGVPLIGAERLIYKVNNVATSYTEMMALPDSQIDTTFWLPWYNNKDLDTQLRIANVTEQPAVVDVYIGSTLMGTLSLAPGASTRVSFAGVNGGPVKIVSTQNIVAAERLIYKVNNVATSFTEMMALPNKALDTTYWLPWYNNKDLDTQLRFANVHETDTAHVHVYIGGDEMLGSPFTLQPGESTRQSFVNVNNGPVQIVSDVPIVAAERLIYKVNNVPTSFTEMMALPNGALDTTYWLPWYNNKDLDTQLRFANVHDTQTATVHVYIGGVEMQGSPFTLLPGESTRQSFANVNDGPVQIVSNVPIVAAERLIYKVNNIATSFSEMMALPASQLDTTYWLPWYNNLDLDTQLRFGVP